MSEIVQFVSYLRASGQIVGAGTTCAPETLASADVGVLTGVSASAEHDYVAAGQVMPKGARPSPAHQFDYASGAWVDPRSLDELVLQAGWKVSPQALGLEREVVG